jgi:hypothetical protein
MSIVTGFVCFVFLGFFLFVLPLSIYLFAKLFPDEYPGFIGFPEDPVRVRDTVKIVHSDDPAADP